MPERPYTPPGFTLNWSARESLTRRERNRRIRICAPRESGVYEIYPRDAETPCYIGGSSNIKNRINSHRGQQDDCLVRQFFWVHVEEAQVEVEYRWACCENWRYVEACLLQMHRAKHDALPPCNVHG